MVEKGPKNSGKALPPLFGQWLKENVFFVRGVPLPCKVSSSMKTYLIPKDSFKADSVPPLPSLIKYIVYSIYPTK